MNTASHSRGLAIYAFTYLAFLYIPVLLLPLFSFNDSVFIAFPPASVAPLWHASSTSKTRPDKTRSLTEAMTFCISRLVA